MNQLIILSIALKLVTCEQSFWQVGDTSPILEDDTSDESSRISEQDEGSFSTSSSMFIAQEGFLKNTLRSKNGRSINGTIVDDHAYPFVVSLHYVGGSHACGGTIIHPQVILTAAHCFMKKTTPPTHVKISRRGNHEKLEISIQDFKIRHEDFNASISLVHDIGLMILKESIPNPEIVRLVPHNLTVQDSTIVTAYGWGLTSENGTVSRHLRSVELQISHPLDCSKNYLNPEYRICTESRKAAICKGDSGGPLMWDGYQIGIVSGYKSTCDSGLPSVFTNVAKYRKWISEKLRFLKEHEYID
ncbi:hypothetical protein QAD02_011925 [Eretmocerus hayati]|uniref:Uncharacterized protein n=1 Tax=Eretmocerus hayati TaxID=131215 RepID=A0ACC2NYI3_9HYME|nr:hypothetical protein QAD02_011925 [Eretmocerus hayati]